MEGMYSVPLSELIEKMNLDNLTPGIDTENILIKHIDVNRPALQLAGFFDYFDSERIQVIGNVEHAYLKRMDEDDGVGQTRQPPLSWLRPSVICAISLLQGYPYMVYL